MSRCGWSSSLRFDYGSIVPWVRTEGASVAIAPMRSRSARQSVSRRNLHTYGSFAVSEGDRVPFVLTCAPSNQPPPGGNRRREGARGHAVLLGRVGGHLSLPGRCNDAVHRSLLTLKAMIYAPTGGIVAAPTTSLPEAIGACGTGLPLLLAPRRDADPAALLRAGYMDEAHAWRDWLLRAIAGSPEDIQIMYGVAGERRLIETSFLGSRATRARSPCDRQRTGQLQLDVYGEVINALYQARMGVGASDDASGTAHKTFDWFRVRRATGE